MPRPARRASAALLAVAVATAALATAGRAVGAQAAPTPATPLPYIQSLAVNPLAIPFGVFSAEYEAALPTPGFTVGVGGTYFSNDGDRDSWIESKGMYYPNEAAFRGFSIGLSLGVHSARRVETSCTALGVCGESRRSQSGATLGVLASYDWLLGRQERFRVGIGAGAKRMLRDVKSNDPLLQVYPDGRFVLGVVF